MNNYDSINEEMMAGVDEVGRGPLAGPVIAAAVILNPENPIEDLMDSKKIKSNNYYNVKKSIHPFSNFYLCFFSMYNQNSG